MKVLLLQAMTMQVGAKFRFGQGHNIPGILVVFILFLKVPVD
jgi:hypothetical protein